MDTSKILTEISDHYKCYGKDHFSSKVIEHGFRLEKQEPDGYAYLADWFLIYRNIDDKLIGRLEFVPNENSWNSRYYFFGGGTTFGGFSTQWIAALWCLLQNSQLPEKWDE